MSDPYAHWKGWSPDDFARFSDFDALYFDWHVKRALGAVARPLRVLEIGFGNGRFLGWLRHEGHQAQGVETNTRLVAVAQAAGFDAATDADALQQGQGFDLIAAYDVLEHVPASETLAFIASLARRLAPGGRLLLRFPNGESPFGLWMQQGDLTHVHALGLSKLRQACAACGLQLQHQGETLPWQALPRKRQVGARMAAAARRLFEWALRKMYQWPRGLDLSPNQLVVLSVAPPPDSPAR